MLPYRYGVIIFSLALALSLPLWPEWGSDGKKMADDSLGGGGGGGPLLMVLQPDSPDFHCSRALSDMYKCMNARGLQDYMPYGNRHGFRVFENGMMDCVEDVKYMERCKEAFSFDNEENLSFGDCGPCGPVTKCCPYDQQMVGTLGGGTYIIATRQVCDDECQARAIMA